MIKKFKKTFYALYIKISLGIIIIIVTTMLLSFFFVDKLLYNYLKVQYKEQTLSVISGLNLVISKFIDTKDLDSLQELTENTSSYSFIKNMRVYNMENIVISSNNKKEIGNNLNEKIVNEILTKKKLKSVEINFKKDQFKVAIPINKKKYIQMKRSNIIGILYVQIDLKDANKLMYDYRFNIIRNVILAGVFLLIIILILLMKKLFSPLIKLSDAIIEVSHGNYKSKIDNNFKLEFSYLIDEFNYMIEQINIRDKKLNINQKKLKDYSSLLEKKVRERTKELYLSNKKFKKIAITDGLTKIYNRKYILEKLESEITKVKLIHEKLSIIMLDIDDFKRINDDYGHQMGDEVLKKTSKFIKKNLRDLDLFGRYGGEEFIVILPKTDIEKAFFVAERIRKQTESIKYNNTNIKITISLGVVEITNENQNEIIRKVDKLMYKAKINGKNRVEK